MRVGSALVLSFQLLGVSLLSGCSAESDTYVVKVVNSTSTERPFAVEFDGEEVCRDENFGAKETWTCDTGVKYNSNQHEWVAHSADDLGRGRKTPSELLTDKTVCYEIPVYPDDVRRVLCG